MFETTRIFYCLYIDGDESKNEKFGKWYKEVNLPCTLPSGTTIFIYAVENESALCGPHIPVEITDYEHWMRGKESDKVDHVYIHLEFTHDNLERNGGVNAVAKVLEFEGWAREPDLSIR